MFHKPYATYSAEELALDDLFVRWVQHPDDEEVVAYWQQWLAQHPHRTDTVETARRIIQTASQPPGPALSVDETSTVWGRIRESLRSLDDVRPLQPDLQTVVGWWYFLRTVAAAVGLIALVGWAVWMQYGPNQNIRTVRTGSGQTRTVQLPDNSSVTLFANSSIRYARCWDDESPRAVWLEGGADFAVKHYSDTSSARIFRVHTPDLTIEAVGTTFRVRQQPEGTRVALNTGHVNLVLAERQSMRLRPGQAVNVCGGNVHK